MIIDAPAEFWDWVDRLEYQADHGSLLDRDRLDILHAFLEELNDRETAPQKEDETATLKWVRQSRRHLLWRLSHPYRERIALRLICWFPPDKDTVVVALFSGDKARVGDSFYDTVGVRADALIEQYKREEGR